MKLVKRFTALVGAGVLSMALCACSIREGKTKGILISSAVENETIDMGPDVSGEDFTGYRVGVSLYNCTLNTYCTSYVQALNETMAEYEVDTAVFDAFGDPGQQAAQIKTLISMGVDLIILWPSDSNLAVSWVQSVSEAGIPVVVANTNVSPEGEQYVEGFVGPSGVEEGYQTACRMLMDLEGRGNIVVLNGPDNYEPARERRKGLKDAITGTKINIIEEYSDVGGQRSLSRTYMEECLKNHPIGEIDAVFCYDDEAALGAFDAMSLMNRSGEMKVYVAASGNYDIMSYIEEGMVAASVIQSPIVDARTTVNYALSILKGNELPDYYNYISTPIVDAENVRALNLSLWQS
ncbi:MAG: sugar ABC transporter substrate-binding protein [Lachnospiraceae bacterium]|nr:sugar ABC transporter substrate-binding protein [Lachnospiraceae bacterium]